MLLMSMAELVVCTVQLSLSSMVYEIIILCTFIPGA